MIRRYVLNWHPYNTEHELYLSGTQEDFIKLHRQIGLMTTPDTPNSTKVETAEYLQKSFKEIKKFVKNQTKLKIHKIFKVHHIIFEKGNGPNQAYCTCGKLGLDCLAIKEAG